MSDHVTYDGLSVVVIAFFAGVVVGVLVSGLTVHLR